MTSIYNELKGGNPAGMAALIAATAKAFEWDAGGLARWCDSLGADRIEVERFIVLARGSGNLPQALREAEAFAQRERLIEGLGHRTVAVHHPDDPNVRMVINLHDVTNEHVPWVEPESRP